MDFGTIKDENLQDVDIQKAIACDFDRENKLSPCFNKYCLQHGSSHTKCIRYMLDYCSYFEDRGCVVNKPQLLNKLDGDKLHRIANMKPLLTL